MKQKKEQKQEASRKVKVSANGEVRRQTDQRPWGKESLITEFNALFYIPWDICLLWEWGPVKSELLIMERKNKNIYYSASVCVNSNFTWTWENQNPGFRLSKPSITTTSKVKQSVDGHVLSTTFPGAQYTCRIWHRNDWGGQDTMHLLILQMRYLSALINTFGQWINSTDYLLSTYYMLSSVLGAGDSLVKEKEGLCPEGVHILERGQWVNPNNKIISDCDECLEEYGVCLTEKSGREVTT